MNHDEFRDLTDREIKAMIDWYGATMKDIQAGQNLDQRLKEVEYWISEADIRLERAKAIGENLEPIEGLRNNLYYLKYEISERT